MSNQSLVDRFLRRYEGKGSLITYRASINRFLKFTNISVDEIVSLAKSDPAKVEEMLEDFKYKLKSEGLAPKSINVYLAAIKSFLKMNRVEVKVKLEKPVPQVFDYIPKPDEVKVLINRAPLPMKVAISLMAFSGMRQSDIVNLKFLNIKDEIVFEDGVYKASKIPLRIMLKQKKTGFWYVTFLGRMGTNLLVAYLNEVYNKTGKPRLDEEFIKRLDKMIKRGVREKWDAESRGRH